MSTAPVDRARERVRRTLQDAAADLAWLRQVYVGGTLGTLMDDLHERIKVLLAALEQYDQRRDTLDRVTALADEDGAEE